MSIFQLVSVNSVTLQVGGHILAWSGNVTDLLLLEGSGNLFGSCFQGNAMLVFS